MKTFSYSEAERQLGTLLDVAKREGAVCIHSPDGQPFIVQPQDNGKSPLDVEGVDLGLTAQEIVDFIHEGRRER